MFRCGNQCRKTQVPKQNYLSWGHRVLMFSLRTLTFYYSTSMNFHRFAEPSSQCLSDTLTKFCHLCAGVCTMFLFKHIMYYTA